MPENDVWNILAELNEPRPDYLHDPATWLVDKAKEEAWSVQRQILDALVHHRSVAVPSCHGVGKSHIASRAAGWWIDSHPPGEAMVVTTAPTSHQVSAVLWRYINQLHTRAKLAGRINRSPVDQWYIGPELVAYGRKPADYDKSSFQGLHAPAGVLVIVDEAGGIQKWLWDAVDSLATDLNSRVLAIGNPDDPGAFFAQMCKPDSDWHVIQVDALRTPNMSAELIAEYPLLTALMKAEGIPYSTEQVSDKLGEALVHPMWVEERLRRWCGISKNAHLERDPEQLGSFVRKRAAASPLFLSKVRGIFPTDASTGVIPLGWVQQAINRWHDWDDAGRPETMGRRVVGVDVAREGEDETVLAVRQGDVVREIETHVKQDTMETVDNVVGHLGTPQSMAVVDVIGIGAGVVDRLRQLKRKGVIEASVIDFNASAQSGRMDAIGEFKFRNDRSAGWWMLRQLLDPSRGSRLALPDDEALMEELVAVRYKVLNGAVIAVEDKDAIRKRIGRSTDRADAVMQSVWMDGVPVDSEADGAVPWGGNRQVPDRTVQHKTAAGTFGELFESATVGSGWDL